MKKNKPIPKAETPSPSNTGPITTYYMSKEEIQARYGHIKPRKKGVLW